MGIDGTRVVIRNIVMDEGDDITIHTASGLEIFVMYENGVLSFCNETNDEYLNESVACLSIPNDNGTWEVMSDVAYRQKGGIRKI